MSQFVLINVVVAVLMKHLDVILLLYQLNLNSNQKILIKIKYRKDSNKMAAELEEMDREIYKQLAEKDLNEELLQQTRGDNLLNTNRIKDSSLITKQVKNILPQSK